MCLLTQIQFFHRIQRKKPEITKKLKIFNAFCSFILNQNITFDLLTKALTQIITWKL